MSQQNKTTLQQSINTQLADNSAGEISAADVRSNMISITDSLVFNNEDQSIVGSIELTGDVTASAFLGDGSALTNLPVTPTFPYTGDAQITGKIILNDGNNNVGIGQNALYTNVNGQYNTAVGVQALNSNTVGNFNTANGNRALYSNTVGVENTANGFRALYNNTTGSYNTAIGTAALTSNTTGVYNTSIGHGSLFHKVTGDTNVAIGTDAGRVLADKGSSATIINDSIFIGYRTSPLANSQTNQIVIGHDATGLGSNTIVLGNDSITTTALKGNVGIGTTTPAEKLTVEGNISGSGNVNILGDVTASAFVGDGSALTNITAEWDGSHNGNAEITGSLIISGSNANLIAFNKIGVGTDNPTADVHIKTAASPTILLEDTTTNATLEIKSNNTDQTILSTGKLIINTPSGLTITGDGKVGVGTTTPVEPLTVEGNISGSGNVNILGDVTASAFVGDGSALTGITSTIADGSVANIKLANDSVILGTTEVGLGTPSTTLAGLTNVEITGSLTVSGSGNTNILGNLYVYGASPAQQFFNTGYASNRVVSNWYNLTGPNLHTEIDPGNIAITSDFTNYLTLRNNGTVRGLSRELGANFTRLAFEAGTINTDGVVTVPKDVTGTIALELKGYTVATLPTGAVGDRAYVTDASAPSFLTSVTGGGAITSPVFHNGTTWVCG